MNHTPHPSSCRCLQLLQALRDIRRRLLHGVELRISRHGPRVVSVLGHQFLQPLRLALAQVSFLRRRRVLGLFNERLDDICRADTIVIDTAPFFVVVAVVFLAGRVNLVERVVEGVRFAA